MSGTQCLSEAIVVKVAKSSIFYLAEAALLNSCRRLFFSYVAEQQHNASHVALSYVNAAEISHKGLVKGHTPSRVTTHEDLANKNMSET